MRRDLRGARRNRLLPLQVASGCVSLKRRAVTKVVRHPERECGPCLHVPES